MFKGGCFVDDELQLVGGLREVGQIAVIQRAVEFERGAEHLAGFPCSDLVGVHAGAPEVQIGHLAFAAKFQAAKQQFAIRNRLLYAVQIDERLAGSIVMRDNNGMPTRVRNVACHLRCSTLCQDPCELQVADVCHLKGYRKCVYLIFWREDQLRLGVERSTFRRLTGRFGFAGSQRVKE